jgi:hypothetical protein
MDRIYFEIIQHSQNNSRISNKLLAAQVNLVLDYFTVRPEVTRIETV